MDAAFKPMTAREVAALLACGPFAEAWSRGAALTLSGGDPLQASLCLARRPDNVRRGQPRGRQQRPSLRAPVRALGRLGQLARRLSVGGAPRVEQLRFYRGRLPFACGLICARIAGKDGASYLVAVSPTQASGEAPALEPEPEAVRAVDRRPPAAPFQPRSRSICRCASSGNWTRPAVLPRSTRRCRRAWVRTRPARAKNSASSWPVCRSIRRRPGPRRSPSARPFRNCAWNGRSPAARGRASRASPARRNSTANEISTASSASAS